MTKGKLSSIWCILFFIPGVLPGQQSWSHKRRFQFSEVSIQKMNRPFLCGTEANVSSGPFKSRLQCLNYDGGWQGFSFSNGWDLSSISKACFSLMYVKSMSPRMVLLKSMFPLPIKYAGFESSLWHDIVHLCIAAKSRGIGLLGLMTFRCLSLKRCQTYLWCWKAQ